MLLGTVGCGLRSMDTVCRQMFRLNNQSQVSEFKVRLLKHLTNIISLTDAKLANGLKNKAQFKSPGVLKRV
jgi:hypothetical protein